MALFSVNVEQKLLYALPRTCAPVNRGDHLLLPLTVFETYERTLLALYAKKGELSIERESDKAKRRASDVPRWDMSIGAGRACGGV